MSAAASSATEEFDKQGFRLLNGVFTSAEVTNVIDDWEAALAASECEASRTSQGDVYAVRNVLGWWPAAADVWKKPALRHALSEILGPDFGLVRVLFFDKPPEKTWTLPWHKDQTIAVREHRPGSSAFTKPTMKAGIPHVEAPVDVLERMATARLHVDDVTQENGPLQVIPGSHRTGKELRMDAPPATILASAGDVLLMRPLIVHASGRSHEGTTRRRRILHFEFAAAGILRDGYEWNAFLR